VTFSLKCDHPRQLRSLRSGFSQLWVWNLASQNKRRIDWKQGAEGHILTQEWGSYSRREYIIMRNSSFVPLPGTIKNGWSVFCRWERCKSNVQIWVKRLKGRDSVRPRDKWENSTKTRLGKLRIKTGFVRLQIVLGERLVTNHWPFLDHKAKQFSVTSWATLLHEVDYFWKYAVIYKQQALYTTECNKFLIIMTGQISDRVLGLNGPNVTLCFVRAVHAYIGLYTAFVWLLGLTPVQTYLIQAINS